MKMPTTIFLSTPPLYGLVITTIMLDSIATHCSVLNYTALHEMQLKTVQCICISPMHLGLLLLTFVLFAILAAHCFLHTGRKGHLCCHLHLTLFNIFDNFSILILLKNIYFHFHYASFGAFVALWNTPFCNCSPKPNKIIHFVTRNSSNIAIIQY